MPYDFKAAYEWELGEWDRHRSSVSTPLSVATILGGIGAFAAQKFEYANEPLTWAFVGVATFAAIALAVAIYQMARLTNGHSYKRIPKPNMLLVRQAELRKWYADQGLAETEADASFDRQLNERYATATTRNIYVNWDRSERLYRANRALIWAVVPALALLPLVAWNATKAKPPATRVEIVSAPSCKP